MQTYSKLRMDILIESALKSRLSDMLESHGVSGYTIFPALGGRGDDGDWSRTGQIIDVGQMLLFTCIVDISRRDALLESLRDELAANIGYITVTAVDVIRPQKFT